MEDSTVTFELTTDVYDILSNALTDYEYQLRADLLYDEGHHLFNLEDDDRRVQLVRELRIQLENANSRVAT